MLNEVGARFYASGGKTSITGSQACYENRTERADARTLLIFGDSNSHQDPIQLTGMFAETFREVHFVWSSSLDWRLIEEVKPDLLIAEIAERFLKRLVNDDFDVKARVEMLASSTAERNSGSSS